MQDNISSVLHNLAPGQWAKILEQDFKQNKITTIGQLANLDAKTVGKLKGVKPPKQQTVKLALTAYHNKIKKEENTFRKGTPVQEETSQEEEERIKEEFFSRPSPSPTDMAVDLDSASEAKEKMSNNITENVTGDIIVEKEKEDSTLEKEESVTTLSSTKEESKTVVVVEEENLSKETSGEDEPMGKTAEQGNAILAEESPEDNDQIPADEGAVKFIPETQSMSPAVESSEASSELKISDENASELVKPTMINDDEADEGQNMETNEGSDDTEQGKEAATNRDDENKEEEAQEQSSDITDNEEEKKELDLTNIMAVMNNTDLDLSSLPTWTLVELYGKFSFHQREVDQFKENLSKIIFGRIK